MRMLRFAALAALAAFASMLAPSPAEAQRLDPWCGRPPVAGATRMDCAPYRRNIDYVHGRGLDRECNLRVAVPAVKPCSAWGQTPRWPRSYGVHNRVIERRYGPVFVAYRHYGPPTWYRGPYYR